VVDDGSGRSTWHQINRNYLGFPDGVHATALRELGETQARKYGVDFLDARAVSVTAEGTDRDKLFVLQTTRGTLKGRTLMLATGVSDSFPEFEGSDECIGKSMFWCIFCDGYEATGQRVVVLGHDDHAAALALQLLVFTDQVVLVAGDEPLTIGEERLRAVRDHGIEMHDCGCEVFQCAGEGRLEALRLASGKEISLDMLFVAQHAEPNSQLAKELNIATSEEGYIVTDAEQATSVEGVYAAGDVTRLHSHQITSAVHEGAMAAAAVNHYLYDEWQRD
jgi:thioredoxin reductase (NADPH)